MPSSPQQYTRQFKKWGFVKNLADNKSYWTAVSHQMRKRKRDGKESQVVVNGQVIDAKKVRKEVLRHATSPGRKLHALNYSGIFILLYLY